MQKHVGLSKCDTLFLLPWFSSSEILLRLLLGLIQVSHAKNSFISHKMISKSYNSLFKFLLMIYLSWWESLFKMMGANKEPCSLLLIPNSCKLRTCNSMLSKNLHSPVKSLSGVIFFDLNYSFIWAEMNICRFPCQFFNKCRALL